MKVPASYSVQRLPLENENAIREIILSSGDNPTENDYLLMMNELATCVLGQSFIKCPVRNCQVTPKGVTDFKDHLNAIHLKYPSHPCVHCDRINFTKKAQKRHLKDSHPNECISFHTIASWADKPFGGAEDELTALPYPEEREDFV